MVSHGGPWQVTTVSWAVVFAFCGGFKVVFVGVGEGGSCGGVGGGLWR